MLKSVNVNHKIHTIKSPVSYESLKIKYKKITGGAMFFPRLVHDYLKVSAKKNPEKEAIIFNNNRYTYLDIDIRTDFLANYFIDKGLKAQDRIVVFMDNCPELIISIYSIMKAGGIFIVVNGLMKARKLSYIINDAGAKKIITNTSKQKVVLEALNDIKTNPDIIWDGPENHIPEELDDISESWKSIFSNIDSTNQAELEEKIKSTNRTIDSDLATLIYTSGSTGDPKGVMSPHNTMISAAKSIIEYLENDENDIILNVLPLSFDYGLYQVIMSFIFGGTIVLEKSFAFLHNVMKKIKEEKVTAFPVVPTILAMILKMQNLDQYDFGSLRYISNTGAALPVNHIKRIREHFPEVNLFSMFGLTECKRVGYLPPSEIDRKPSSVGIPMSCCQTFVLDENDNQVKPGEIGELVIRGSNVMRGYWNAPEITAKTFRPGKNPGETWLYSGDNFTIDEEGFLYFIGRKDDMLKSKGERISSKEVENVICEYKGVIETAVIGVPDEILGQAIKAFVVIDGRTEITDRNILKHCTLNLESFAVPKFIEFVQELPRSAHGKIDKKALKAKEADEKITEGCLILGN